MSQNLQKITCVGVSFLIKLQAEKIRKCHKKTPAGFWFLRKLQPGNAIPTSNCCCTCILLLARRKSKHFYLSHTVVLLITGKSGN